MLQVSLLALSLTSCTYTYGVPKEPVVVHSQHKKIDLNVNLRLFEALRSAKWERHLIDDTWIIPLGGVFSQNAEMITRQLFSRVVVTSEAASPALDGIDATLTPRMISVDQPWVQGIWNDTIITVIFEWALRDSQGNIVWIDTITAEGREPGGSKSEPTTKRVKKLLEDLFQKSFDAMSSSREIKEFAARRR
jgi:hypothetical protein